MLAFQSYLNSKRVKEVLKKKPGEEGFSLLELVVVVAVLAVLATIALPAFNDISAQAARASAKSTLATIVKECAVDIAMGTTPAHAVVTDGGGLTWSLDSAQSCGTAASPKLAKVCVGVGTATTYGANLYTGAKLPASDSFTCGGSAVNYSAW